MVVYGIHYFSELSRREKLASQAAKIDEPARRPAKELYGYKSQDSINSTVSFNCDGRTHCSQMKSLAEATYFVNYCPGTKMDGDHDGQPCEQQFQ